MLIYFYSVENKWGQLSASTQKWKPSIRQNTVSRTVSNISLPKTNKVGKWQARYTVQRQHWIDSQTVTTFKQIKRKERSSADFSCNKITFTATSKVPCSGSLMSQNTSGYYFNMVLNSLQLQQPCIPAVPCVNIWFRRLSLRREGRPGRRRECATANPRSSRWAATEDGLKPCGCHPGKDHTHKGPKEARPPQRSCREGDMFDLESKGM